MIKTLRIYIKIKKILKQKVEIYFFTKKNNQ